MRCVMRNRFNTAHMTGSHGGGQVWKMDTALSVSVNVLVLRLSLCLFVRPEVLLALARGDFALDEDAPDGEWRTPA